MTLSTTRRMAALIGGVACLAMPALANNTSSLQHELVLDGLDNPWDMAFLDDGTMFYTEKCKGLSVRMPDGSVTALLGMGETEGYASTAEDLFCEGQAGMMGVAVDPDFDSNRRIYVYSTSNMVTPHTNRLMRLTVAEDSQAWATARTSSKMSRIRWKPRTIPLAAGGA